MNEKHKVFNLIILDESGSMESIKKEIISGFNEVVQSVKEGARQYPEQKHYVTFVSFNSSGIKTILENQEADKFETIDENKYIPSSATPLYDAMGFSIRRLKNMLDNEKNPYNVLVTILTDGYENASKEYSGNAIKKLVEELKLKNWTFTYIGTDHEVEAVAYSIGVVNSLKFNKSSADVSDMFGKEKAARSSYYSKISKNEKDLDDFYEKEDDEK